jgi:four helix bundle protein
MSQSLICERSFRFACRILKLGDQLCSRSRASEHLAVQLMRCATSIGSNAEEAQEGQTKADFIAKLSISRKEARETVWWLNVAINTGIARASEVEWELDEARQLLAMIRSAILTARSSPRRTRAR